ncbi:MAG: lipoprotein-releasing ABC transporter permease subunit [Bordetella sp.]|nr:MAG: lipoprotein-releasing ABC transporter permease subunit [Bordetella sp.]
MPYEIWIGAHYAGIAHPFLKISKNSRRKDRFISFISNISMIGIAIGVSALIITLSVMNGFQKEVRDKMLSMLSHIEILSPNIQLNHWKEIAQIAESNLKVQATAPFFYSQSILIFRENFKGIQIKGINTEFEHKVSKIHTNILKGEFNDLKTGEYGIILGKEIADNFGIEVGNNILLVIPQNSFNLFNFYPRMKQMKVVGIFSSGHYEYDSSFGFLDIEDAVKIFQENGTSGIRLHLEDMHLSKKVSMELEQLLPPYLAIRDWSYSNQMWFTAIQTEKKMMFLILTLIIAVAAFNLLSSLVMTVKDKQSDIAVLRTIGSGSINIGLIFLAQGAIIGIIGTTIGIFGGICIAQNINSIISFIESVFNIEIFPCEIYIFSVLPCDLRFYDIATISSTSILLSLIATIYPSWRASRLQPTQLLRYD